MYLLSMEITMSPSAEKTLLPSIEVTSSSVEKITLSSLDIVFFSFHAVTLILLIISIKKLFDLDKWRKQFVENLSNQDSKNQSDENNKDINNLRSKEIVEQGSNLKQNVDWLISKVRELMSDSTTSETVQSKSLEKLVSEFESLIDNRIPTVAKNIIRNIENQNIAPLKIRSEMAKRLFPDYRISNIDSLIVDIVYELSKYVAELLGCNTSSLSQYDLIPEQIEELATLSVNIKHDAECANSSSKFWREVKGTTYDLSRHKAVNYDPELYKALNRDDQNINIDDNKPYAKIAFTIAPGYSIFDHLHKKERVLVPALVYLDENV
jgi:hypothetical protein